MSNTNSIQICPSSVTMREGSWFSDVSVCGCECGECCDVIWHSEDTSVATVNESNGQIYGKGPGNTRIYASSKDESVIYGYIDVVVEREYVTNIVIGQIPEFYSGTRKYVGYYVEPSYATCQSVTWSFSPEGIVERRDGELVALKAGTTTMTVAATDGSGVEVKVEITVKQGTAVESITIDRDTVVLSLNDTIKLNATVLPENASDIGVHWVSENTRIAEVNQKTGVVTPKQPGIVDIVAYSSDESKVSGKCHVYVMEPKSYPDFDTSVDNSSFCGPVMKNFNVESGAYTVSKDLLSLFAGQKLKLTLGYNSTKTCAGIFGNGWYHNYEKHILVNGNEIHHFENPGDMFLYSAKAGETAVFVCSKAGYELTVDHSDTYPYVLNCNYERTEYYDSEGRLAKVKDRNGFETLITYGDNGTVNITDSVTGKSIHIVKSTAGYVTRVYDDDSRYVTLSYSSEGNLILIYDATGKITLYEYDNQSRIIKGMDATSVVNFTNAYDESGRLINQTDAMNDETRAMQIRYEEPVNSVCNYRFVTDRCGKTSVYEILGNGAIMSYTDANSEKTEYEYDDNFNCTREVDANGNTLVKVYDANKRVTSVTDKLGRTTVITYNALGNVTQITHPQIGDVTPVETFRYNERNQIKEHIDLRGTRTYYMYYKPEDQEEITSGEYQSKQFDDDHVGLLYRKITYDSSGEVSRVEEYTYTNGLLTEVEDARGNKTEFTYYSNGLVKTKKNAQGNVTQYTYDNAGNVLSVTDALGNVVTYSYDANNHLIDTTDAKGNKTLYTYDNNGLNTCVRLPDGSEIKYEYDNEGRKIKEIDQAGAEIEYIYDAGGRLVSKLLPNDGEFEYVYSKSNGKTVVRETDPLGAETVNTYDAENNLVQQKDNNNNVTTYEYNSLNKVVKVTDPAGNVTSCVYSAAGDLLRETDADGNATTYTYDEYGNLKTKKDPRGNTTTYAYDSNNNLISKSDALSKITMYTYNSLNQLASETNARGYTVTYGYDALGRRVSVTDARGNTFRTYYDANGNVVRTEDAYGNAITETEYNELNQPISITDAKGTRTFTYTATGKTATVTDAAGNTQTYTYDEVGNNTLVKDVLGHNSSSTYDELGNIKSLTGPNAAQINYSYDEMGRLLSKSIDNSHAITYTYNTLNQKSSVTNGRGQTTTFEYTPAGRPKVFNTPCGEVEFTYDANGNIHTAEDNNGTVTRVYDKLNRLESYKDTYDNEVYYDYDEVGNITKIKYPDTSEVTYTYDANNNITSVTDWADRVTQYTYDNNNNLIGVTHANGCTTTHTYDNKQRLTRTVEKTENDTIITSFEYYYDEMGRIIKEKDLEKSVEVCYTYDKLSRVKERETVSLTGGSSSCESFIYDAAGNVTRSSKDEPGSYSSTHYTYDSLTNRLASYDGCTPTYDADGNMLTAQLDGLPCSMTYDYMNRLVSAKNNTYTYNAENMRIRNVCDMYETEYTYDPNGKLNKLIMKNTNGSVKKYVYGLGLIGEDDNGHFKTYHFDYRGSTVAITNESGAITDRFAYDTYGKQISHTGNSFIIFGYNGRDGVITDVNGLLYMSSRYYSPELRRFVNADSILKTGVGDIINALNSFHKSPDGLVARYNPIRFEFDSNRIVCEDVGLQKSAYKAKDYLEVAKALTDMTINTYTYSTATIEILDGLTSIFENVKFLRKGGYIIIKGNRSILADYGINQTRIKADNLGKFENIADLLDSKRVFSKSFKKSFDLPGVVFDVVSIGVDVAYETSKYNDRQDKAIIAGYTAISGVITTIASAAVSAGVAAAVTKIGALAGTAIYPGLGTAIGTVAGLVVGIVLDIVFDNIQENYIEDILENN